MKVTVVQYKIDKTRFEFCPLRYRPQLLTLLNFGKLILNKFFYLVIKIYALKNNKNVRLNNPTLLSLV